jgi:hypothetical protein
VAAPAHQTLAEFVGTVVEWQYFENTSIAPDVEPTASFDVERRQSIAVEIECSEMRCSDSNGAIAVDDRATPMNAHSRLDVRRSWTSSVVAIESLRGERTVGEKKSHGERDQPRHTRHRTTPVATPGGNLNPVRIVQRALAIVLLCSSPVLAQPKSHDSTASLRAAYRAVHSELEAHDADWSVAEKDPAFPARLNRAWTLVAQSIARYLDTHPSASARDVERTIASLNHAASSTYRLDGNAVQLVAGERAVWAVSASFERAGTFLVLARDANGPFTLRWNIKELAAKHEAAHDEIGYWASNAFSWGDGPLVGRVKPIVSSRGGRPCFSVDAHAAAIAGGTFNNQISVWEWDGRNAVPLFIKSYAASFDTPPNRFTAGRITVRAKGDYKSFSTCGACPDPEVSWQIRITPDAVTSSAPVWTNKELAACDELFDAVINRRPANNLAAPQVLTQLRKLIAPLLAADPDPTDLLGMLMQHRTITRNGRRILEITADNLRCGPIRFPITNRNGAIYFAEVQVLREPSPAP